MDLLENRLQRTPASHQVCSTGATVRSHGQDARRACLAHGWEKTDQERQRQRRGWTSRLVLHSASTH
eukprot:scaffold42043_cov48-Phaeocystis_antarctica.AAC.1